METLLKIAYWTTIVPLAILTAIFGILAILFGTLVYLLNYSLSNEVVEGNTQSVTHGRVE